VPELTLEQYASMCAEIQVAPGEAAAIHARYGAADEAAASGLRQGHESRFAADPSERARFDALVAQYVTALQSQAASPSS
jgi:hypothetical protein